ncbi:MAG: hypothetical protein QM564_01290 [Bergeyella sp.]
MKNLKQLSRNELKTVNGGKLPDPGDCGTVCNPGDGFCEQYGLSCGFYFIVNGGTITSSCNKCM